MTTGHMRRIVAGSMVLFLASWMFASAQTADSEPSTSRQTSSRQFSVTGIVLDPSGAVVSDTLVILAGGDNQKRSVTTDAKGNFRFDGLRTGEYEIRTQPPGFKPYAAHIRVQGQNPAPLRIALQIAVLPEEITVDTGETGVNTDVSSNVNAIKLDRQMLDNLPILGQDIVGALSKLLDPASVRSGGPALLVDGMPSTEVGVPASAIQEIRIDQNPYSAEFARPGKGRIEIITKSGSPTYHGSFDLSLRDYRLDARNRFAAERPHEQHLQFEGYLSGPVAKIKHTTFLLSASRSEDDLQSVVYGLGLQGPIRGNVPNPQRKTYASGQITHQMGKNSISTRYNFFDWSDKGEGVGGFSLPEVGMNLTAQFHQLYTTYKVVVTPKLLNQFLIRIRKEDDFAQSVRPGVPKIVVLDAFTGGGGQVSRHGTDDRLELADVMSWSRGNHLVKGGINIPAFNRHGTNDRTNFDGTFYFASLDDYAHGRPFSFERQQGDGRLAFWQKELGLFIQDEVRLLPNFSMAYGLRYDWQNHISDHKNFAPRLSLAFAPGKRRKTVFRGGAGIFFDMTGPSAIADALRFDGVRLREVLLENPGYPAPLSPGASLAALPSNLVRFAPDLRSPYSLQYSVGVERQLAKSLTWTTSYLGTRGVDLFRSRDVNAPPPPMFLSRPNPLIGVFRQIESRGHLERHSLETTLRGNLSRFFNGMVVYEWERAYDDTDGISAFPADNYNLSGEWSRASFDLRHFFYVYGTVDVGRFFKLGIVFSADSGRPYSIKTGHDDNHDGFANDRPPGVRRNSLQGPGSATLDLRWSKDFFFRRHDKKEAPGVTIGLDAFNLLNRVNYSSPVGNLSSPFFGQFVAAGPARRMQVSLNFKF